MGNFFKKQGVVRMIVIVIALLLVVGLVGGVLAATKTSSGTTSAKTVTSSSSSSNSGSSSSNSGSEVSGGGDVTQYTLTYSLGEYGTGDVPDPVTVEAGAEVEIEFENDLPTREGFVFIGWDIDYEANDPTYTAEGTNAITMTENVTLYPIFASAATQYTLTYELGNDAMGFGPGSQTVNVGESVNIWFSPYPSCVSDPTKEFKGWSTTDESSMADYSEDSITSITMYNDVTLYPVFGAAQPITAGTITIVNNSSGDVNVLNTQGYQEFTVASNSSEDLEFVHSSGFVFEGSGKSFEADASFTGVYNGVQYNAKTLIVTTKVVHSPEDNGTWILHSGDNGTLTISDHQGS